MANINLEYPNGGTDEFIHAYGITYYKKMDILGQDMRTHIENVRDIEIRDDDIYLVTYPKCGTHWVWEILVMLKRGNAEYETKTKEAAFLDFRSPEIVGRLPSPRILNCHFPCKLMPKEVIKKGTKIVHVMRNPKDAFVSFHHHCNTTLGGALKKNFQDFLPLMLGTYGFYMFYPWFKYVKEWERFSKQHPEQIINLYFEDLKEDPVREIRKINDFLGTGRSDDLLQEIAVSCDFKNLKKADEEIKEYDAEMKKKMPKMYRKGEVGDWKNHFTVAQNEQMNEWLEDNLIDTNLSFRYTI